MKRLMYSLVLAGLVGFAPVQAQEAFDFEAFMGTMEDPKEVAELEKTLEETARDTRFIQVKELANKLQTLAGLLALEAEPLAHREGDISGREVAGALYYKEMVAYLLNEIDEALGRPTVPDVVRGMARSQAEGIADAARKTGEYGAIGLAALTTVGATLVGAGVGAAVGVYREREAIEAAYKAAKKDGFFVGTREAFKEVFTAPTKDGQSLRDRYKPLVEKLGKPTAIGAAIGAGLGGVIGAGATTGAFRKIGQWGRTQWGRFKEWVREHPTEAAIGAGVVGGLGVLAAGAFAGKKWWLDPKAAKKRAGELIPELKDSSKATFEDVRYVKVDEEYFVANDDGTGPAEGAKALACDVLKDAKTWVDAYEKYQELNVIVAKYPNMEFDDGEKEILMALGMKKAVAAAGDA